jgi:hypothetical protein
MTPNQVSPGSNAVGISIPARLVPSFSYIIGMGGAALGSVMIVRTFQGMRNAETAGIAAVAGGLSEASQAMAVALYLAVFFGVIALALVIVRALTSPATASPSGWFFIITGALAFTPIGLLWKAESLIVNVIAPGSQNVVQAAASIQMYLTMTTITAAVFCLIVLVAALLPLPAALRAKRIYGPIVGGLLIELALIGMAVAFQLRASWLFEVRMNERF